MPQAAIQKLGDKYKGDQKVISILQQFLAPNKEREMNYEPIFLFIKLIDP